MQTRRKIKRWPLPLHLEDCASAVTAQAVRLRSVADVLCEGRRADAALAPKIFELPRAQFQISGCVRDVFMTEPQLQPPRIVARIG